MSDYVRNKAVIYPIDVDLFDKLDDEIEEPFYTEVFSENTKLLFMLWVISHLW